MIIPSPPSPLPSSYVSTLTLLHLLLFIFATCLRQFVTSHPVMTDILSTDHYLLHFKIEVRSKTVKWCIFEMQCIEAACTEKQVYSCHWDLVGVSGQVMCVYASMSSKRDVHWQTKASVSTHNLPKDKVSLPPLPPCWLLPISPQLAVIQMGLFLASVISCFWGAVTGTLLRTNEHN